MTNVCSLDLEVKLFGFRRVRADDGEGGGVDSAPVLDVEVFDGPLDLLLADF